MQKFFSAYLLGIISIGSLVFADEAVTTKEGRKVLLKDDKTWDYVDEKPSASAKYAEDAVEVWDKSLELTEVNYRKSVALHLHYKNNTDKKVIGISVCVSITNAFGKKVYENTFNDEVVVEPGDRMKNPAYWHFDDNPFISDEPYDRLWPMAQNGTARIETKIMKVVFEDGTVLGPKTKNKEKKKKAV